MCPVSVRLIKILTDDIFLLILKHHIKAALHNGQLIGRNQGVMKYELVTGSTAAAAGGGEVQSGGRQVTLKHSAWRVPSWKRNVTLPPVMTISSIG